MTAPVEPRPRFGELLRELRLAAGLSQEALAERAAMSKNGVSALERGINRAPQRETLGLLVEALHLNPEQRRALEQAAIQPSRPRERRRAQSSSNTNLPRVLSTYVGRETETAEIRELVERHQLVTLVGSGGVGKTRTSLRVAGDVLEDFEDGVWFIELAPLASGAYIGSTVAKTLGIPIALDDSAPDSLARSLEQKDALLVFDSCEHLIEHAAIVIATILRGCPKIKIFATSRQRLGILGETVYRLPSLDIESACALFADRARAIDYAFALTGSNAPTIAGICSRLDGIPLAIELAASRINSFSPVQLYERLSERFRILTGGGRDVPSRQQTLRALIDWSYELLNESERATFRSLSIFVKGFTIAGATAVGAVAELDAFDTLGSLIEKSLVVVEPVGDAHRYSFLESTRLYGFERLTAAGEWDECARRHLHYMRDLFFGAGQRYERTARISEVTNALVAELEDVRAALDWSVGNDPVSGAELLAEIRPFWRTLGLHGEGITRIQAILAALPKEHQCLRARLWATVSFLAGEMVDTQLQTAAAAEAIAHARICGDTAVLVEALLRTARSAAAVRRFNEAEAALREADALGTLSAGLRAQLLGVRAVLNMIAGDLAAAGAAYEELRKEHRAFGNVTEDRGIVVNLAEIEHARGETQHAIALLTEALNEFEAGDDRAMLATAFANFAGYLNAINDPSAASAMARDAIRELADRQPAATDVAVSVEHLALALALSGDLIRAAVLEGYADAALHRLDFKREFTEMKTHERLVELLHEHFAPEELARRLVEGENLTPVVAIALALESP